MSGLGHALRCVSAGGGGGQQGSEGGSQQQHGYASPAFSWPTAHPRSERPIEGFAALSSRHIGCSVILGAVLGPFLLGFFVTQQQHVYAGLRGVQQPFAAQFCCRALAVVGCFVALTPGTVLGRADMHKVADCPALADANSNSGCLP
jgi:hypothetical protein